MTPEIEPSLAIDPELTDVLAELVNREPIFHRPELGTRRADFENMTVADFWRSGLLAAVMEERTCWTSWRGVMPFDTPTCGKPRTSIAED